MKKNCAREALKYIKKNSIIGLGGGATISHLITYLKEADIEVTIVTPSFSTQKQCVENGLKVLPTWAVDSLDIAFDGCDEVDYDLNALKSGGGIHTKEKIIAKMAKEYILLVDENKVVKKLEFKYPVVLEIIPESKSFVEKQVKKLGGIATMRSSSAKDGATVSDHGLYLMDVNFNKDNIESISNLNDELKKITGVVETSLFHNIVAKAIVASEEGTRVITKE